MLRSYSQKAFTQHGKRVRYSPQYSWMCLVLSTTFIIKDSCTICVCAEYQRYLSNGPRASFKAEPRGSNSMGQIEIIYNSCRHSTGGTEFKYLRRLFNAVIAPRTDYGALIWHRPERIISTPRSPKYENCRLFNVKS